MTKTIANSYTLTGDDTADTLVVQTVASDPNFAYEYTFNLIGNGGDDRFRFYLGDNLGATNATINGTFKGGDGTDTLELDFLGASSVNALMVGDHVLYTYSSSGSSGSFDADSTVERFVIKGSNFADDLVGSSGADWLEGRGGIDTFHGSAGDDAYVLDNSAERVVGETVSGGKDTIWAYATVDLSVQDNVENLRISGNSNYNGYGNGLANLITGDASNNVIAGAGGIDSLYGKGGLDTFKFAEFGTANADNIWDFDADDHVALDSSVFTGLVDNGSGALAASSFRAGTAAIGASAQIIYNANNGNVYYDDDGAGGHAAELVAFIGKKLAFVDASDFLLV